MAKLVLLAIPSRFDCVTWARLRPNVGRLDPGIQIPIKFVFRKINPLVQFTVGMSISRSNESIAASNSASRARLTLPYPMFGGHMGQSDVVFPFAFRGL
jgi:hypothetical protein